MAPPNARRSIAYGKSSLLLLTFLSAAAVLFFTRSALFPSSIVISGTTSDGDVVAMGNSQKHKDVAEGSMAPEDFVKDAIRKHKVLVFSKSYCPYCAKAKAALASLLKPDQIVVIELDERPDGDDIQDVLGRITGGRTVPRVFIGGEFIGGGDDTARKARNGELQKLLTGAGVA